MERDELQKRRQKAGLTQTELANRANISQNGISLVERGLRRPSVKTAKKIAAVLGFDWTEFYEEKE